jgi:hypothetical protein
MNQLQFHKEWLEHNGKTVIIENEEYKINVRTYKAIYPYEFTAIDVYAERGQYGYDLLDCSEELFVSLDQQLGGIYKD